MSEVGQFSHGLKMVGIDAESYFATVMQIDVRLQGTESLLVVEPVGSLRASTTGPSLGNAITAAAGSELPNPAHTPVTTVLFDVIHRRLAILMATHIPQGLPLSDPILRSVVRG